MDEGNVNHLLGWVENAMNAAADRMIDVERSQPELAFAAIGETLWWVCILDDALRRRFSRRYTALSREDPYTQDLLNALRHARNRFAHSLEIVEYVEPTDFTGGAWEGGYRVLWKWASLPELPKGRGKSGEELYEQILAGKDVKQSLVQALTHLRTGVQVLRRRPGLGGG